MTDVAPVREPIPQTLAKYGLDLGAWWAFIPVNGEGVPVCPICEKPPRTGRFVIDHKHVPGYAKLPPEHRAALVRGVCCTTCNHFVLTKYGSVQRHLNAARYLDEFERRYAQWEAQRLASSQTTA